MLSYLCEEIRLDSRGTDCLSNCKQGFRVLNVLALLKVANKYYKFYEMFRNIKQSEMIQSYFALFTEQISQFE